MNTHVPVVIRFKNAEEDVKFPVRKIYSFKNESEIKGLSLESGDWLFPWKYNQGGFDLALLDEGVVRFFQLTLGSSPHSLKLHLFRSCLEEIGRNADVSAVDIIGLVKKENLQKFEFEPPISHLRNIAHMPVLLQPIVRIGCFSLSL